MTKARDLANFISTGVGTGVLADGAISVSEISDLTATAAELNNVAGINTSVQAQLDGKQAVVAGVSSTEIGYLDGVTSALQTQLDNISVTSGSLTKSFASGETASITLAQAISPAPVVSATKEVPQEGISSKGTWDVNASASNYELHDTAYSTTLIASSVGYNLSLVSNENKAATYNGQDLYAQKIAFSTDGTKFYLSGNSPRYIYQYNLTTAWDISTASYSNNYYDYQTNSGGANDISMLAFKADGTKMYAGSYGDDTIYEHDLSTAWDISTVTYNSVSKSISFASSLPMGLSFKPDGTAAFSMDMTNNLVIKYNLSTAWDISSISGSNSFNSGYGSGSSAREVELSNDGTKMYILFDGSSLETIKEYALSTAWDITTASITSNEWVYSSDVSTNVPSFVFKDDGTKIYIMNNGHSTPRLEQFSTTSSALVLGTGSFASTDVGKRIQGNGGDVTLTSTAGAYDTTGGSAFTDTSTIASGSWSMRGLKSVGDADGIGLSGAVEINPINFASASYDNKTVSTGTQATSEDGVFFKPDGTRMYVLATGGGTHKIWQYDLSTVWDVSTASYNGVSKAISSQTVNAGGIFFKPDGLQMFTVDRANVGVDIYTLSTAWDLSTLSYNTTQYIGNFAAQPFGIFFKPDGTKMYICDDNTDNVRERTLTTAWDVSTNGSGQTFSFASQETSPHDVEFTSDGLKMYIVGRGSDRVHEYDLSTAWDVTSASYNNVYLDVSGQGTQPNGLHLKADDQSKLYVVFSDSVNSVMQYSTGASTSYYQPTSQYHIGITNSGGQIDTSTWLDINTMVADQDAGDGTVHYAVSTDDRTTWSVIKEGSGVRPIVRDNSGTWQYNSDNVTSSSFAISGATYSGDAATFATNGQDTQTYTVAVKPDGTKIYVASYNSDAVYQYDLSTAFDLTTASYNNVSFSFSSQMSTPRDIQFKPDGTEMYLNDRSTDTIYQYTMSAAWDLSTASYSGYSFNTSITNNTYGIFFKPDGTKLYISDGGSTDQLIYEHDLSVAWRVSTASYNNKYLNARTEMSNVLTSFAINPTGTKVHAYDYGTRYLYEYDLSTAWDMSTASYNNVSVSLDPQPSSAGYGQPTTIHLDYTSGYLYAMRSERLFEWSGFTTTTLPYSTTTTWANSTTNDEFYALQQALSLANNRMDKTQLDAVTDPNHYTLGDTLDLAIALRMDTASASSPTADGVTINYDAASLNQGAVLGTDYDYDFPDSTTVRVTSNAAQNLKIRVV
jgi:DNA-binding beta-propeller fold protein YncE